jgi:hypothetical protein
MSLTLNETLKISTHTLHNYICKIDQWLS